MKRLFLNPKTLKNRFIFKKLGAPSVSVEVPTNETNKALSALKAGILLAQNSNNIPKLPDKPLKPSGEKKDPLDIENIETNPFGLSPEQRIAYENRVKKPKNSKSDPKLVFADIEKSTQNRSGFNPDSFSSELFV